MIEEFERGRLLEEVTTLGIGGPAEYFSEARTISSMQQLLSFCRQNEISYFILGKGSNTLFDDRGYRGLVIANRIDFLEVLTADRWHVGAGYSFSLLGTQSARKGLSGLEFASGIPGSVGGAVYMNAGANGSETCNRLLSVDFVSEDGSLVRLPIEEIEFGYRYSSFQKMKGAIVGATFGLIKNPEARQKQLEIIDYRKKTQPYNAKSAGCIFRNPTAGSAGAIIEKTGLKGKRVGNAEVSRVHANFIVNSGNARSVDLLALIREIREEVQMKTGIVLESELRVIPFSSEENDRDR